MLGQLGNESTDMNYQEEDLVVQWRTTTNAGKSTYAGKDARRQTPNANNRRFLPTHDLNRALDTPHTNTLVLLEKFDRMTGARICTFSLGYARTPCNGVWFDAGQDSGVGW